VSHDTQKQRLLSYLKRHHYITRMDAFRHCGCCNLWARISELESDGYKFDRRWIKTRNEVKVLQYWLRSAARKAA
jgi:hypothetical protein